MDKTKYRGLEQKDNKELKTMRKKLVQQDTLLTSGKR